MASAAVKHFFLDDVDWGGIAVGLPGLAGAFVLFATMAGTVMLIPVLVGSPKLQPVLGGDPTLKP